MPRIIYNKLVRDRIPEIIESTSKPYQARILNDEEYLTAIKLKLIEEAQEVNEASESDLLKEIADVYTVLDALVDALNLEENSIQIKVNSRIIERGAFKNRIFLEWVDEL